MQNQNWRDRRKREAGSAPRNRGLQRSLAYLGKQGWQMSLPYIFLIVATLAQLLVPRMVRDIIDSVTNGVTAKAVLERLPEIPAAFVNQAIPTIIETLKLDLPTTATSDDLVNYLTTQRDGAPNACARISLVAVENF